MQAWDAPVLPNAEWTPHIALQTPLTRQTKYVRSCVDDHIAMDTKGIAFCLPLAKVAVYESRIRLPNQL